MWTPMSLVRFLLDSTAKHLHADHDEDPPAHPPLAIDDKGWLSGHGVELYPSVRSQALATEGARPIGVVSHWSATAGGGRAAAKRIAKAPKPNERSSSWHVWITRDGKLLQSVSFRRGAWHAGGETAQKFTRTPDGKWVPKAGGKVSANALFVGVEFECVGEVRMVGGRWMGWPFGRNGKNGPIVDAAEVVEHRGDHYHTFTLEQEVAALRLWTALAREYPIDRRGARWGHVDLDPTRKSDPGPIWKNAQLPRILDQVFGPLPLPAEPEVPAYGDR